MDFSTIKPEDRESIKADSHSVIVFPTQSEFKIISIFESIPTVGGAMVYEAMKDFLLWAEYEPKYYIPLLIDMQAEFKRGLNNG